MKKHTTDQLLFKSMDNYYLRNFTGMSYDILLSNLYAAVSSDLSMETMELFVKEVYQKPSLQKYNLMFLSTLGQFNPRIFWLNWPNFIFYNYIKDISMIIFMDNEKSIFGTSNFEPRLFGYIGKLMNSVDTDIISSRYDNVISRSRLLIEVSSLMMVDDKKHASNDSIALTWPKQDDDEQIFIHWKKYHEFINKDKNIMNINKRNGWTKNRKIFGKTIKNTNQIHNLYMNNHPEYSEYLNNFWSLSSFFTHASTSLIYSIGWEYKGLRLKAFDEAKKTLLITFTDILNSTSLLTKSEKDKYTRDLKRLYDISNIDIEKEYESGMSNEQIINLHKGMLNYEELHNKAIKETPWLKSYLKLLNRKHVEHHEKIKKSKENKV